MLKQLKRNWQIILSISILLTVIWFTLGALYAGTLVIDNPSFTYTSYRKIYNWDLLIHVIDQDFDGDKKNDLVTFTGCVFLTRVSEKIIPANKQCVATGISSMFKDIPRVGQKYIHTDMTDLNLDWPKYLHVSYSYAFRDNSSWYIVVNEGLSLNMYKIGVNGLLENVQIPWSHRIHVVIYRLSELSLLPVFFLMAIRKV
jgi:hypothetical protein